MTDWRLILDLDEETRARWQAAADREAFTLTDWIRETCQVASDPESGADIINQEGPP